MSVLRPTVAQNMVSDVQLVSKVLGGSKQQLTRLDALPRQARSNRSTRNCNQGPTCITVPRLYFVNHLMDDYLFSSGKW